VIDTDLDAATHTRAVWPLGRAYKFANAQIGFVPSLPKTSRGADIDVQQVGYSIGMILQRPLTLRWPDNDRQ
jgi:hypothetical protein